MRSNQVNVLLRGGPLRHLPEQERTRAVSDPSAPVKVMRSNRYDHFEPSTETVLVEGRELLAFDWSGTTYVTG